MKNNFLLILILLIPVEIYSQFEFNNDPESFELQYYKTDRLDSILNNQFKIDTDFDFEFRLYEIGAFGGGSTFVLSQKNKEWTARYFDHEMGSNNTKEYETPKTHLDRFWHCLDLNKVLSLPTEDSIKQKLVHYEANTRAISSYYEFWDPGRGGLIIADGAIYVFQLRTKESKRAYCYHCPKSKLKYYPNVEEYYRAFIIVALVRKMTGRSMDVC